MMSTQARLAPEVWSMTIREMRHQKSPDDLTYLWTTARQVCKQFKVEIEAMFRQEHLPKTWLLFDRAMCRSLQRTQSRLDPMCKLDYDFEFKFIYKGLSPTNDDRATFLLPDIEGSAAIDIPPSWKQDIMRALRARCGRGRLGDDRSRYCEHTDGLFVSQIRGSLSDCKVPSLATNVDKREISIDVSFPRSCFSLSARHTYQAWL